MRECSESNISEESVHESDWTGPSTDSFTESVLFKYNINYIIILHLLKTTNIKNY